MHWRAACARLVFFPLAMVAAGCGDTEPGCEGRGVCEGTSVDGSERLFDGSALHDFNLEIPQQSWRAINDDADPGECMNIIRPYHAGGLTLDDQTFAGVGIHIKGGCGSSRNLDEKAAFKVNISWDDPAVAGCPATRELLGQRKLAFNNSVQDASHTREFLAYQLFRAAGVPAPRVTHVRLSVNGEYWGIYNLVETIERAFLKRWFADHKGMMWEGAYHCDVVPKNVPNSPTRMSCFDLEFTRDECDGPLDPRRDPQDWSLLSRLAQGLATQPTGTVMDHLAQYFDLEQLFAYWAVESALGHWDGFFGRVVNNFRVYHHPSDDRYYFIPWGTDQTLEEPIDVFEAQNTIARLCLPDRECNAAFRLKLKQVVTLMGSLALDQQAIALGAKLAPLLSAAPRGRVSEGQLQREVDSVVNFVQRQTEELGRSLDAVQ